MPDDASKTKAELLKELSAARKKIQSWEAKRKLLIGDQERYRNFLDDPIMIGCFEMDVRGRMTYINPALHEKLGYEKEEYLELANGARAGTFYVSPEEYERVRQCYQKIYRTGRPEIFQYQIRDKKGHIRTSEAEVSLIRNKKGDPMGFRGISRDVTERNAMLADLSRYKEFFENVEDICFEMDLKGNLTFVNQAATLSLGFSSKDEILGVNNRQYSASPEQDKKIAEVFKNVFRTGRTTTTEYPILDARRQVRHLYMSVSLIRDENGAPRGFRGVSRDITERKKIEREQERYRNFIENIEDGCYEMDLQGHPAFSNESTRRIMGYSQEELSQINYQIYSKPDEAEKIRKIFAELYRTGQPTRVYSHEIIRKDGETRTLMASASLIRDTEGKPVGFRGICQDITERKRLEEQEIRLMQQLHQAQKMEAIGTLAGGIAHDFNNLLMGIQGYTSLMLLNINSAHPHFDRLKAIESIIQSAADLTRQLLGYARGGRYEVKPINLNELVDKSATLFGRTKKELRIFRNFAADLWSVEADQGQMEQVFLNLFVNAWQAMPGGGDLYLETRNVKLDEKYVKPYDIPAGPYVKISVTDTGVGMDEQMKARIFEPFFTTKGMGRGTGIGLASVYGIVRGHKGIITVYSEKGHGANFNICLPASEKAAASTQPQPVQENLKGSETILLADDEEPVAVVTSDMLTSLGYKVLVARSGEEAVALYQSHRDEVDLVIMDMIMPGCGGGPAVDQLHGINPSVKVVLSSGYSLNGMIKDVMDRGRALAFIQKPFMMGELSHKIRQILDS